MRRSAAMWGKNVLSSPLTSTTAARRSGHILTLVIFNGNETHPVELNWLEHLWEHKNMFETRVVRANEC